MDFFASGLLGTPDTGAHGSTTLFLFKERQMFTPLLARGEFQQNFACGAEMGASVNHHLTEKRRLLGRLGGKEAGGKWLEFSGFHRSGMWTVRTRTPGV